MCVFKTPKPSAITPHPAIKPRVETDTALPVAKEMTDPDKTADVEQILTESLPTHDHVGFDHFSCRLKI